MRKLTLIHALLLSAGILSQAYAADSTGTSTTGNTGTTTTSTTGTQPKPPVTPTSTTTTQTTTSSDSENYNTSDVEKQTTSPTKKPSTTEMNKVQDAVKNTLGDNKIQISTSKNGNDMTLVTKDGTTAIVSTDGTEAADPSQADGTMTLGSDGTIKIKTGNENVILRPAAHNAGDLESILNAKKIRLVLQEKSHIEIVKDGMLYSFTPQLIADTSSLMALISSSGKVAGTSTSSTATTPTTTTTSTPTSGTSSSGTTNSGKPTTTNTSTSVDPSSLLSLIQSSSNSGSTDVRLEGENMVVVFSDGVKQTFVPAPHHFQMMSEVGKAIGITISQNYDGTFNATFGKNVYQFRVRAQVPRTDYNARPRLAVEGGKIWMLYNNFKQELVEMQNNSSANTNSGSTTNPGTTTNPGSTTGSNTNPGATSSTKITTKP